MPSAASAALSWRAHSGAWLSLAEHLHDAQGVGGSNPSAPTRDAQGPSGCSGTGGARAGPTLTAETE